MTNVLLLDPLKRGAEALLAKRFSVTTVDDPWVALQHVQEQHFDALVIETSGLRDPLVWFLEQVERLDPELPSHTVVLGKVVTDRHLQAAAAEWDVFVLPRTVQARYLERAVRLQRRPRPADAAPPRAPLTPRVGLEPATPRALQA
jgi:hypothetical protein